MKKSTSDNIIGHIYPNTELVLSAPPPNFRFALREDLTALCEKFNSDLQKLQTPSNRNRLPGEGKELSINDFLPTQSDPQASGYDVRCAEPDGIIIQHNCYVKITLGIRMFAPHGWWLKLAPRSSTFMKLNIHPLYGVIDENFEGEMVFVGQYLPDYISVYNRTAPKVIHFGDRIGQLIPVRRQLMTVSAVSNTEYKELTETRQGQRGEGGFGASGTR